jgi:hypothetical protein
VILLLLLQSELLDSARKFLSKAEIDARYEGLAALALLPDETLVAKIAKAGPKEARYPDDFAMAYAALAVVQSGKFEKEAKAFVEFLVKRQNKEGDWAYDFSTAPDRWSETSMNVPILEAMIAARADKAVLDRAARWIETHQTEDGRFLNDRTRPASTETTAACVSVLARLDRPSAKKAKVAKLEDVLGKLKSGTYEGLTKDDLDTWGPDSFPYAVYYTALAERRTGGIADDRRRGILESFAKWQGKDGSFDCKRGKVYGTAMVILALEALRR